MIALFAVTAAGRRAAAEVAAALDATPAELADLPALWPELDGAVFFLATGATVRLIAPLLADKRTDPGVVCVDEARRFAVALAGGHGGGANALAARVAAAARRPAGDHHGVRRDRLAPGWTSWSSCSTPRWTAISPRPAPRCWTAPPPCTTRSGSRCPPLPPAAVPSRGTPIVDHRPAAGSRGARRATRAPSGRVTRLVPPTLVVGIGSARGVPAGGGDRGPAPAASREHGLRPAGRARPTPASTCKADEPGILAAIAPAPLHTYPAAVLAGVAVPNPSEVVRAEVGTPSVAEAAALHAAAELAGGAPVELVVEKTQGRQRDRRRGPDPAPGPAGGRRARARCRRPAGAAGRRRAAPGVDRGRPRPVRRAGRAPAAARVPRCGPAGSATEEQRAADAVALAAKGHAVALIGSGDAGVYAMASPALQQAGAGHRGGRGARA